MVDSLAEDLQALRRTDARLGIGMESSHRLFDARWLRTPAARFELVGVVNRMDRSYGSTGILRRHDPRPAVRAHDGATRRHTLSA